PKLQSGPSPRKGEDRRGLTLGLSRMRPLRGTVRLGLHPVRRQVLAGGVGKNREDPPLMTSLMRAEIEEIPDAVARLLEGGGAELRAAGAALRERDPAALVTIARGSSDHAAAFLKYAVE